MQSPKRSPLVAILLAIITGLLVVALLNGVIRPTEVIAARSAIAPGTILTDDLLEVRTIPMGARPEDALTRLEDASDKMLAVGRAPGDLITTAVLGEAASAGIPTELPEGYVALAIHVDSASGVAGLLRPGQTVTVIGLLTPDILRASSSYIASLSIPELSTPVLATGTAYVPTPTPTPEPPAAPLARIALTGLRVLMVPQSFRYEELPASASEDQLYASARTTLSAQEGSVIVLAVPTALIEVAPGFKTDPAALLSALDQYGLIHLALEPAAGLELDVSQVLTLNLGDLYNEMNASRKR